MTHVDPSLRVEDFDYYLPPELIAQVPLTERSASRLLVIQPETGLTIHSSIRHLPEWLAPGDLVVVNNTKVMPARLHAVKADTGAKVEFLLLNRDDRGYWTALAKPARKLAPGGVLHLAGRDREEPNAIEIVETLTEGEVLLTFAEGVETRLDDFGEIPLPPYIKQRLDDPDRYQTVFASELGSAAAPTAGLHITPELRDDLARRGIGWAEVTLHVGLDTFRPVTVDNVSEHKIHREWARVPDVTARAIALTRGAGGRVIALGTTAARTLETLGSVWDASAPSGFSGWTDIFITPGYRWTLADGMITNFHLPRSTLMMMVSSLAGADVIKRAYTAAIIERYRFFSFGDAMLILPARRRETASAPLG